MTKFKFPEKGDDHTPVTWEEAKAELYKLGQGQGSFLFRGHHCSSFQLSSSLERKAGVGDIRDVENSISAEFSKRQGAYLKSVTQSSMSNIESLVTIQHYGGPTRLLDFTSSPFVAAFFAARNAMWDKNDERKSKSFSIWAISNSYMHTQNGYKYEIDLLKANKRGANGGALKDYTVLHSLMKRSEDGVMFFEPQAQDDRMFAQKSWFAFSTNTFNSFQNNLATYSYDKNTPILPIVHISIKAEERLDVLNDLNLMGISDASLFPGLGGFCKSLDVRADMTISRLSKT